MTVRKMCDMPKLIAATVFQMLNPGKVDLKNDMYTGDLTIITDVEPRELIFPEGWYYAKGSFRNKHQSTTGLYEEVMMKTSSGQYWDEMAKYCTLDCTLD